jgi:fructose-1-phosphate kinase PfkB-like protein
MTAAPSASGNPGPTVSAAEWHVFLMHYRTELPQASDVAPSGSLPCGLASDAYASLVPIATDDDVPTILYTGRPARAAAMVAHPSVAKANAAELEAATGQRSKHRRRGRGADASGWWPDRDGGLARPRRPLCIHYGR